MPATNIPQVVLQYGVESAAGTLVAATRVVDVTPGSVNWKRDMNPIYVRNAGSYATAHRAYAGQETTEVDWSASATFNRLVDYGNLFFNAVAVGTGSGTTRTWTFTPSDTTDGLKRYSFEYGGTNMPSAYTLNGAVGKSFAVSIKPNTPWDIKATVLGMATTAGSITGSLSLPSSLNGDDVLWTQTKVYVDTSSTFGTTQHVGDIVSADFQLTNGVDARHTLDAAATPFRVALDKERSVEVTVVAEYDLQTEYTAWAAATQQRVQLKATGPNSRSAILNINGIWDTVPIGQDQGVVTLQMKLKGLYESAVNSSDVQMVLVNGVTTTTSIP